MPESLHNIVKESISIREGLNIRYCDSKKQRINDTIQCMKYIIDYCNNMCNTQVE